MTGEKLKDPKAKREQKGDDWWYGIVTFAIVLAAIYGLYRIGWI